LLLWIRSIDGNYTLTELHKHAVPARSIV